MTAEVDSQDAIKRRFNCVLRVAGKENGGPMWTAAGVGAMPACRFCFVGLLDEVQELSEDGSAENEGILDTKGSILISKNGGFGGISRLPLG